MKKNLTTICISSVIFFGQCVVEGAQKEYGLAEWADTVREHLRTIKDVMDADLYASEVYTYLFEKGKIDKEEYDRREIEAIKVAEKIKVAFGKAASAFKSYRKAFPGEIDFLKYVKKYSDDKDNEHVALFNEFLGVIEDVIAEKYFDRGGVDEILMSNGISLRSLGLKNCLDMYTLFIASRYFDSIEDHIHFVMSSRRLRFNMEKFFYNPLPLTKKTREFFSYLQTLYIYSKEDEEFDDDDRIKAKEVWHPYDLRNGIEENTKYHNLVFTKDCMQEMFDGKSEILRRNWPDINGYVALDDSCLHDLRYLTKIELPRYVTRLGNNCFPYALEEIFLPDSLKAIGENCFSYCNIRKIEIPQSCMALGSKVFSGCRHLTRVVLPEGLEYLPEKAFRYCRRLVSISIPASVLSIGEDCFDGCSSLVSISIPTRVTSIGEDCFDGCSSLVSISIPTSVLSLGEGCFEHCTSLVSISIPTSVSSIGGYCFGYCSSLSRIEISTRVTKIEFGTFADCTRLQYVKLPENLSVIEGSAFYGCSELRGLTIPSSVQQLEADAFQNATNLTLFNESTVLLNADDLGVKAVENVNLKGLDTEELMRKKKD